MGNRQSGFTIIEVSLFLAISATLILLTIGLSQMVARQRFQDTMTTLQSVIQSEYEEVRNGINPRLAADAGTGDSSLCGTDTSKCLTIGKVVKFSNGSEDYSSSYVVATGAKSSAWTTWPAQQPTAQRDDVTAIKDTKLAVTSTVADSATKKQTSKIQWGSEFVGGYTVPPDGKTYNSIAILRSPVSNAILVFAGNNFDSSTLDLSSAVSGKPLALFVKNGQSGFKGAAVCIGEGSNSVNVKLGIPADSYFNFGGSPPDVMPGADLKVLCGWQ